jgi:hypothetical protein
MAGDGARQALSRFHDPGRNGPRQQRTGVAARGPGEVTPIEASLDAGHVYVEALVQPIRPAEHGTTEDRTQTGDLRADRRLSAWVPVQGVRELAHRHARRVEREQRDDLAVP